MGAILFCNLCKANIKEVKPDEVGTITGEEICESCEERINTTFSLLESIEKKYAARLKGLYDQAKEHYERLDQIHSNFTDQNEIVYAEVTKELETLKANVLRPKEEEKEE